MHKNSVVISSQGVNSQKTLKHMVSLKSLRLSSDHSGELLSFVIKVAALEAVRRFSKKRCPILWKFVQAFQVLSYPPLKWLQRWGPLRLVIRGAQKVSKPLLLLSIATAFSNDSDICRVTGDGVDEDQPLPNPLCRSPTSESLQSQVSSEEIVPDNWLLQLYAVLEKQGISLPARFNEDELRRFYTVANGDLACLVSSLKKTIRWRESYNILSSSELEVWSHLVFWHGFGVMLQPYLVIRLGLACSTLAPHDRPRFAQAIVSQVDHGISNLTDDKDSQITVLMDCDGLSPFRFPMNMMRSCSTLIQDHFPNRLGTLYILRLPPVVRILAQTFIQSSMTKPVRISFAGERKQREICFSGEERLHRQEKMTENLIFADEERLLRREKTDKNLIFAGERKYAAREYLMFAGEPSPVRRGFAGEERLCRREKFNRPIVHIALHLVFYAGGARAGDKRVRRPSSLLRAGTSGGSGARHKLGLRIGARHRSLNLTYHLFF